MENAPFRGVHALHAFEGFEIEGETIVARCDCGALLGTAPAVFRPCPDCDGAGECSRCAGTGRAVDHAALVWEIAD